MNKNIIRLINLSDKLMTFSDKMSTANKDISDWNVSRHIEHILLVNTNIFKVIYAESLDATQIKPTKLVGYFVLTTKYLPRGRNKTMENLVPKGEDHKSTVNELEKFTKELRAKASQIEESINKSGKYNHHIFGGLTRKQWLRFMYIHSLHHYKILLDITKQC